MAFVDKCCEIGYIYGYKIETEPHYNDHVKLVIENVDKNQSTVCDIVFPWNDTFKDVEKIIKPRVKDDWDLLKYYVKAIWEEQNNIMKKYYHYDEVTK